MKVTESGPPIRFESQMKESRKIGGRTPKIGFYNHYKWYLNQGAFPHKIPLLGEPSPVASTLRRGESATQFHDALANSLFYFFDTFRARGTGRNNEHSP